MDENNDKNFVVRDWDVGVQPRTVNTPYRRLRIEGMFFNSQTADSIITVPNSEPETTHAIERLLQAHFTAPVQVRTHKFQKNQIGSICTSMTNNAMQLLKLGTIPFFVVSFFSDINTKYSPNTIIPPVTKTSGIISFMSSHLDPWLNLCDMVNFVHSHSYHNKAVDIRDSDETMALWEINSAMLYYTPRPTEPETGTKTAAETEPVTEPVTKPGDKPVTKPGDESESLSKLVSFGPFSRLRKK